MKVRNDIGFWLDNLLASNNAHIPVNPNTPQPQGNWQYTPPAPNRPVKYPRSTIRIAAIITDSMDKSIVANGFNFQAPNDQGPNLNPICAEFNAYRDMQVKGYLNPAKIYIKSTIPSVTPFKSCMQELATVLPNIIVVHVSSSNDILFEKPIGDLI